MVLRKPSACYQWGFKGARERKGQMGKSDTMAYHMFIINDWDKDNIKWFKSQIY